MTTTPFPFELKKYLSAWLEHLSPDEKLDLIVLLSESLKDSKSHEKSKIDALYGAWADDDQTAEDLISDLRKARTFNRIRETL